MRLLCVVLLAASAARAQSFADRVPADSAWYVSVPDAARSKKRAAAGPLAALWRDPDLRPITFALLRGVAPRRAGDVTALDLLALADGEVAVADVGGEAVGWVECGARARLFEALLVRYHAQQARDVRIAEREVEVLGRTIVVRRSGGRVQAHVRLGDAFAFAASEGALRRLVLGPERPLAAAPPFREARRELAAGADLFAWVAPGAWLEGVDAAWRERLGLDTLRWVAGTIEIRPDGLRSRARVRMDGRLRILAPSEAELGPPPFLPAGTGLAATIAIDWAEAVRLFDGGEAAAGLARALGPELTIAFVPPAWARDLGTEAIPDPAAPFGDLVLVQEVARPRALARLLDAVAAARLEDGTWILRDSRFPVAALCDGHLVLAPSRDALRALRRARRGVRETEAYARASALVPARRSAFAFADSRGLSGPPLLRAAWRRADPRLTGLLDALDRHKDVSAFAMTADDEGLLLTWHVGLRD